MCVNHTRRNWLINFVNYAKNINAIRVYTKIHKKFQIFNSLQSRYIFARTNYNRNYSANCKYLRKPRACAVAAWLLKRSAGVIPTPTSTRRGPIKLQCIAVDFIYVHVHRNNKNIIAVHAISVNSSWHRSFFGPSHCIIAPSRKVTSPTADYSAPKNGESSREGKSCSNAPIARNNCIIAAMCSIFVPTDFWGGIFSVSRDGECRIII